MMMMLLCCRDPGDEADLILAMGIVSSNVDSPVFYYEVQDFLGICVDRHSLTGLPPRSVKLL